VNMLKIYVVLDPNNTSPFLRVRAFVSAQEALDTYETAEEGAQLVETYLEDAEPGIHIKHQVVTGGVGFVIG